MKKFALAMIASSAAVFGFGLVADAYPPGAGKVTATPATGAAGYDVTVKATCLPGEGVTFAVVTTGGATASATCGAAGTAASLLGLSKAGGATATLKAPTAAGTYSITATGTVTGALGSASITVTAAGPGLPATGSDGISSMTIIALGLFGVGAGLFAVSQVRRRQTFA